MHFLNVSGIVEYRKLASEVASTKKNTREDALPHAALVKITKKK